MTREQYIKILEGSLDRLNKDIDFKIISGQKYSTEAKAHKALLAQIRRHHRKNLFRKVFLTFQF